ncbi:MAG: peptidoglycan DD-metalloendopeptidase family protein [Bacteroidetes bacterium]|nr:peptidoglycan DD-metalloendopeptidase family protein [Bacteroidota bacterium]
MGQDLYVYDSESCTYVKQRRGFWAWMRINALFVLLATALATGWVSLSFWWFPSTEAARLQQKNQLLRQTNRQLRNDLNTYSKQLQALRKQKSQLQQLITNNAEEPEDKPDVIAATRVLRTDQLRLDALQDLVSSLQQQANRSLVQQQVLVEMVRKDRGAVHHVPTGLPLKSIDLICGYGSKKTSYTAGNKLHDGVDLNAAIGTPVFATGNGTIVFAGHKAGGGTVILIDHGQGYVTGYRHLESASVYAGSYVRKGQTIGLSGNTGLVRGPHLHYEVLKQGRSVDPIPYMVVRMAPLEGIRLQEKARQTNQSME